MKYIQYQILLICIVLLFTTCKKYPQGGLVGQSRLHLFGGHKAGCSKTWKLKLYEVNGIDSTNLIQGANDLSLYDVTFKLTDSKYSSFEANSFYKDYRGSIGLSSEEIGIALRNIDLTHEDSIQCEQINTINYCFRNIFLPEIANKNRSWDLKKLTKKELVIEKKIINTYKIILIH